MVLVMLPLFMLAIYEKNGQPLEKIIHNYVQVRFVRPKHRPYQTNNFYVVLERQYHLDKEVQLRMGYHWFADEQPSHEIKEYVERHLDRVGWKVDVVLSHTCPRKYEPMEHFMPGIDQAKVDKSTENWLDAIEDRLDYKEWYCGHWHINKQVDKLTFLFHDIRLFG